MISVKTLARIGPDGMLLVSVPTPLRAVDVEVIIVVHSVAETTDVQTPEERGPQGEDEQR